MATKKRPSSEEIKKGLLLEGNFGATNDTSLPLADPLSTTQMVLTLEEIKAYDKNPRRERNPAYDEIKTSIRSKKQLNNHFNVTRRPNDDKYMIESGGNTRLKILNELYLETADEVFNTVHCLFVPWLSESSVLSAHLIENEMRGDMMLIDKAYAVHELRRELEEEKGSRVSDREFTKLSSKIGYSVSTKTLRTFNYALKLDQIIPTALRSGIGSPKIEHIKKVEKAYLSLCKDEIDQFDAAFSSVMSENDTDKNFDFDQVRNDLDFILEKIIGIRSNIIYMKINQIMENNPGNKEDVHEPEFNEGTPSADQIQADQQTQLPLQSATNELPSQAHGDKDRKQVINPGSEQKAPINSVDMNVVSADRENTLDNVAKEKQINQSNHPPALPLKRLREKGYALALKIAGKGLEDTVMETKKGLGFLMETPQLPLVDLTQVLPENTERYYRWWILFILSEQALEKSHFKVWEFLDIYHRLANQQHNKEDEIEILESQIGSPITANNLIYYALQNTQMINDTLFTDIFRLMENNRKIRRDSSEKKLWSV